MSDSRLVIVKTPADNLLKIVYDPSCFKIRDLYNLVQDNYHDKTIGDKNFYLRYNDNEIAPNISEDVLVQDLCEDQTTLEIKYESLSINKTQVQTQDSDWKLKFKDKSYEVFFNLPDLTHVMIKVEIDTKIREAKQMIFEKTGIFPEDQILIKSSRMENDDTFGSCNFGPHTTGELLIVKGSSSETVCRELGFQICLKTILGNTICIHNMSSSFTVGHLKQKIQNSEDVPSDEIRLMFAGKQLENHRTMAYYNIQKESTIHWVLNLRGGMYSETSGRNGGFGALPKITILFWTNDSNQQEKLLKFVVG